jgi:hypothetical protein
MERRGGRECRETLDGCIMGGRRSFRTVLYAGHDLLSIYMTLMGGVRTRRLVGGLVAGLPNFHASGSSKHTLDVTIDSDCKEY